MSRWKRHDPGQQAARRRPLPVLLLAVLVMVLAACGQATSTPTPRPGGGTGSSGTTPTPTRPAGTPVASPAGTPGGTPAGTPGSGTSIQHPTGPNDLVLLIEHTGGFVPVESLVTSMPFFALYGDGRMITHGPQTAIFPPQALPNLRLTRLNEAGIQAILREAQAAGLTDGDKRYTYDRIADAQWTEFTTVANGRTSLVAAYALTMDVPANDLPADQRAAREKLKEFQNRLSGVDSWLPASAIVERDADYPIDRLQIVSTPISPTATPATQGLTPQRLDWPLSTPLSQLGDPYSRPSPTARCAVLQGQDLTTVLGVMRGANTLTQWVSAGQPYSVYPRPLLPHETGCPTGR